MSSDKAGSSQLRLSGFSSLASTPSTTPPPPPARVPSLPLSICTGREEQLVVSSEDGHRSVRARKNKEASLRSRERKKAYTQGLEEEVQRLLEDNLKLKRQCKQEQEARDVAGGSRQLAAEPERLHLQHHPSTCSPASLSLGIGTGGAGGEEKLVVSSDDGHRSVYTQELEKEVQGLLEDNLKLKRQCKQLQSEIAAVVGQQPSNKQSSPRRRTSTT